MLEYCVGPNQNKRGKWQPLCIPPYLYLQYEWIRGLFFFVSGVAGVTVAGNGWESNRDELRLEACWGRMAGEKLNSINSNLKDQHCFFTFDPVTFWPPRQLLKHLPRLRWIHVYRITIDSFCVIFACEQRRYRRSTVLALSVDGSIFKEHVLNMRGRNNHET